MKTLKKITHIDIKRIHEATKSGNRLPVSLALTQKTFIELSKYIKDNIRGEELNNFMGIGIYENDDIDNFLNKMGVDGLSLTKETEKKFLKMVELYKVLFGE